MQPARKRKTTSLVDLLADIDLAQHFERLAMGKWMCIKPIGFSIQRGHIDIAPESTFTVGTNFMGVDMAFLLDGEYERHKGKMW